MLKKKKKKKKLGEGISSFEKSFKKANTELMQKRFDSIGKSNRPNYLKDIVEVYKMKDGENAIRILPPVYDDYMKEIFTHEWIGSDMGSYLCPKKNYNKRCPICDVFVKYRNSVDEEHKLFKEVLALSPKRKILYWVLDVSTKPQSQDALLMLCPPTLSDDISRQIIHRKTKSIIDITDKNTGREIIFDRVVTKGKKFPEYKGVQLGEQYPVDDSSADKIFPFDEILKKTKFEKLLEVAKDIDETLEAKFTDKYGNKEENDDEAF